MEEDLGVKKIIMVEKREDRFDLRSFFIKHNYLKVFIWRNFHNKPMRFEPLISS